MPTDIQKQTTIAPGATGIAEDKAVGGIKIYPNPSKGKFTMQIADRHLLKGSCNIEIYTVLGEKIYSYAEINQQKSYEINLSNIPKGIYFIKIHNGNFFQENNC